MDNFNKITTQDLVEMQKGTHKSQQKKIHSSGLLSESDRKKIQEKNKIRKLGETWIEVDANGQEYMWEQKQGYRVRTAANMADVWKMREEDEKFENKYPNCKSECRDKIKTRLDAKFANIYGMCTDCAAEYETKLKMAGEWETFEKNRMYNNAVAFFSEKDSEIKEVADRLKVIEFVNENNIEKWVGGEERAKAVVEEYNTYKDLILEALQGKNQDVAVI